MDNNKVKYIELPLKAFVEAFPGVLNDTVLNLFDVDDNAYVVRYTPFFTYIEIGYSADKWCLR